MIQQLSSREIGLTDPKSLRRNFKSERALSVELNGGKNMEQVFSSGVNSIDIEKQYGQYLISAGSESKVAVYDISKTEETGNSSCKAIASVDRSQGDSHKFSIETVQWYPRDNGMFLTSSLDKSLKVWDSNLLQVAEEFSFPHFIYSHHMSSRHCLTAVACDASKVQLCDLRSGSATHTLKGHKKAVLSVRWSPRSEYVLASGSRDNRILIWDVRKASGFMVALDQYNRHTTSLSKSNTTAHNGHVNGLCFTNDGLHLLSYGTDGCLRLWDLFAEENSLINYGKLSNDRKKSTQIAVSNDLSSDLVFVPSGKDILVFEIFTGQLMARLTGHYDSVACCSYYENFQELYSGGSDTHLLVWSSYKSKVAESSKKSMLDIAEEKAAAGHRDAWSSDED